MIILDRFEVLNDLISFRRPAVDLSEELSQFDWDYDGEPVVVCASDVRAILEGFISNQFSAKDVKEWANLIECREDLDYEDGKSEVIEEIIYVLANPVLQGEITKQSVESFLAQLKS